ncbi:MAG TPA: hypothetical protein VE715_13480 [Blastocatellia bacterium]|nr:hypothetical protein [Blastocatellia bacterium]
MSHLRTWTSHGTLYFAGQISADDAAFLGLVDVRYSVLRPEQAQQQATALTSAFKSICERVAKDAK